MGVNLRLLVVVLGLRSHLVVRYILLGPLGVRGVDLLLLAMGLFVITKGAKVQECTKVSK